MVIRKHDKNVRRGYPRGMNANLRTRQNGRAQRQRSCKFRDSQLKYRTRGVLGLPSTAGKPTSPPIKTKIDICSCTACHSYTRSCRNSLLNGALLALGRCRATEGTWTAFFALPDSLDKQCTQRNGEKSRNRPVGCTPNTVRQEHGRPDNLRTGPVTTDLSNTV